MLLWGFSVEGVRDWTLDIHRHQPNYNWVGSLKKVFKESQSMDLNLQLKSSGFECGIRSDQWSSRLCWHSFLSSASQEWLLRSSYIFSTFLAARGEDQVLTWTASMDSLWTGIQSFLPSRLEKLWYPKLRIRQGAVVVCSRPHPLPF